MRDIDLYTKSYLNSDFEVYQVQYRRKKVIECIKKYSPSSVLEIGCGMNPLFRDDRLGGIKFTVIEPSIEFYKNAVMLNADCRNTIINDFFDINYSNKYAGGGYDMIICSSLLHEVDSPKEILNAIRSISLKNTICHINVPNAMSFHRLLAKESNLISDLHEMSGNNIALQQSRVFDMNSLSELVETSGFKIVDKGSFFLKPFTHRQMMEMLKNNVIDTNILNGLDRMTKYFPEFGSEIYVNITLS